MVIEVLASPWCVGVCVCVCSRTTYIYQNLHSARKFFSAIFAEDMATRRFRFRAG